MPEAGAVYTVEVDFSVWGIGRPTTRSEQAEFVFIYYVYHFQKTSLFCCSSVCFLFPFKSDAVCFHSDVYYFLLFWGLGCSL